jgi:hypothetical protein
LHGLSPKIIDSQWSRLIVSSLESRTVPLGRMPIRVAQLAVMPITSNPQAPAQLAPCRCD